MVGSLHRLGPKRIEDVLLYIQSGGLAAVVHCTLEATLRIVTLVLYAILLLSQNLLFELFLQFHVSATRSHFLLISRLSKH